MHGKRDKQSTEDRLKALFGNPNLRLDEPVTDDSLEQMQFVMLMEEAYGFEITDEEEDALHLFTDFVKLAESKT